MKPILILKLGATFPSLAQSHGDFEDWIRAGLDVPAEGAAVVDVTAEQALPEPQRFCGVVLTGSHAMVSDRQPWSERTAAWLPKVLGAEVPLLGICYGHQLMAHAMGGEAGWNPRGCEFGTTEVLLHEPAANDPLFRGLPPRLRVHVSHAQSVLRLPPGAVCLASSAHDPHHAFVLGKAAWGVQFHPEFDEHVAKTYIRQRADAIAAGGADPERLLQTVGPTPDSHRVLKRFGQIARAN